jgi:hypothetical protein
LKGKSDGGTFPRRYKAQHDARGCDTEELPSLSPFSFLPSFPFSPFPKPAPPSPEYDLVS